MSGHEHDWNLPTSNPGIYWCRACGVVSNTLRTNVPCLTAAPEQPKARMTAPECEP